jgi:hypothetical protein
VRSSDISYLKNNDAGLRDRRVRRCSTSQSQRGIKMPGMLNVRSRVFPVRQMANRPSTVKQTGPIVFQTIINGRTVRVYKREGVHAMKKRSSHLEKVSDYFGLGITKVTIKEKAPKTDKFELEFCPWKSEIE